MTPGTYPILPVLAVDDEPAWLRSLRVTLGQDKKLKIAFTMKDKNAKNLLESSKGVLMRMFEKKGMKLESLEVKVRGEA